LEFPVKYEVIDYIGIALGIVATVGGSILGYFRRRKNIKEQGYAEAEALYIEYLQSAVDHPLCASPDQEGANYTPEMHARHTWFVSTMLYACDKILSASDDPVWKDVIKAQLRAHKTYLTSEEFIKSEEITWYGEDLYQLYKEEFKLNI
jgi:hypothetical protein